MDNNNKCIVCNCNIPAERVEFLIENNKEMTCLAHSITTPVKALYSGEHGTSELIFCDKVYNDNVRSKFYNSEVVNEDAEESEDDFDNPDEL